MYKWHMRHGNIYQYRNSVAIARKIKQITNLSSLSWSTQTCNIRQYIYLVTASQLCVTEV